MTYTGRPLYLIKSPFILCWRASYENFNKSFKKMLKKNRISIRTVCLPLRQAPHIINSVADWWSCTLLVWYGKKKKICSHKNCQHLPAAVHSVLQDVSSMSWCKRLVYEILCFEVEKKTDTYQIEFLTQMAGRFCVLVKRSDLGPWIHLHLELEVV